MRIRDIESRLVEAKNDAIAATGVDRLAAEEIALEQPPDPEMGDRGFPCFALAPHLKKPPPEIAAEVADAMREKLADSDLVAEISTAGPYVNISLNPGRLADIVVGQALDQGDRFAAGFSVSESDGHWMVEFSSPNTNKPQHLGHVRNNLLGDTVSSILDFGKPDVTRVSLINDRGIHICKSMLAYQRFGGGETPESAGEKGDHFVGRFYVLFTRKLQEEYEQWQTTDEAEQKFDRWLDSPESESTRERFDDDDELRAAFFDEFENDYFNEDSELGADARQMLGKWEDGDDEVVELWNQMNEWVLDGFDETYRRLGIEFDHIYFESQTYERGKEVVEEGLESGLFHRRADGAVVCDLDKVGLDGEKVLLRGDGTAVYMTQELGTALLRFDDHDPDRMVYVVGDEQEYHFRVLFNILAALRPELEDRFHHLAYGMVELPEGKMKSREGKVVDADDLLDEMHELARSAVDERYDDLPEAERQRRSEMIGLAALKFYILDFAPRTTVQFDPEKSIDFQGRTGPYCLYGYARISSIRRRAGELSIDLRPDDRGQQPENSGFARSEERDWPDLDESGRREALQVLGTDREMEVIRKLQGWPETLERAADRLNPGRITEYLFELCSAFSGLYNDPDHRIVELEGPRRDGLLLLSRAVQNTLKTGLGLLGIATLEEM